MRPPPQLASGAVDVGTDGDAEDALEGGAGWLAVLSVGRTGSVAAVVPDGLAGFEHATASRPIRRRDGEGAPTRRGYVDAHPETNFVQRRGRRPRTAAPLDRIQRRGFDAP